MIPIILDCSVAVSFLAKDENSEYATAAMKHVMAFGAHVPKLFMTEVVNAMITSHRRGRWTEENCLNALRDLESLPVTIDQTGPANTTLFSLGSRYNLTSYDAVYFHLARTLQYPMATLDQKLQKILDAEGLFFKP